MNIKHTIGAFLYPELYKQLEAERGIVHLARLRTERLEEEAKNQNIADYIRKKYKGIIITDTIDDLLAEIPKDEREGFTAQAKELQKNETLQRIISYLVRKQLTFTAMEAVTTEEMNFARATVNGLSLLNEEIDELVHYHDELHARQGDFDKFSL
jgi:hypothetical protein